MIKCCISVIFWLVSIVAIQAQNVPHSSQSEEWRHELHVKTNVLGLAIGVANVALEVDVCKHLSLSLPLYYSAWDYFKPTLKFRTLTIQPEMRYWFNRHNEGWFLGAHFGMGYYNIALDGEYRIQDYNRETPSLGGGLSVGYRTHLSKNKRWKMEFSVGGGYYDSKYDKFRNEENGFLIDSYQKKWIGVDQASISFAYAFNLKKKGGKR